MSVAPKRTVIGRAIKPSASEVEAEPESEGIAVGVRIRIRNWDNARGGALCKLALQVSRGGRLPIELAFELIDGPFLGLELPFKVVDFLLLRFHEGVYTTGLCVACVV